MWLFPKGLAIVLGTMLLTAPVAAGQRPISDDGFPEAREASVLFFDSLGCGHCDRLSQTLSRFERRHPNAPLARLNVGRRENRLLQVAVTTQLDVPRIERLATPMVVSGHDALWGKDIPMEKLEKLFASAGDAPFWSAWDAAMFEQRAWGVVRDFLKQITVPGIILAGIVDGVNPCAFAVIVFLMSCLVMLKGVGRGAVAAIGFAFAFGVFACYLAIGMGLLSVLRVLQDWAWLTRVIVFLTGCGCLALAGGAFWDAWQARRHGPGAMRFGMPKAFHSLIHRLIRKRLARGVAILTSFVLGMVVSGIELVCTGQIYLPVLMLINAGGLRLSPLTLLIVYNLAFIMPLILLIVIVLRLGSAERLVAWARRNAVASRVGMGGVLLLLAGLLFATAAGVM